MKLFRQSPRMVAITAATVALAGAAVVLARPQPVSIAALGDGWRCSRTALLVTTCSPAVRQPIPAVETSSKDASRSPGA
jgi:hypothetical protein